MYEQGGTILPEVAEHSRAGKADEATLLRIYRRLYQRYGPQHWWPGDSRLEIVLGAILTQRAAWTNVEKALSNLKTAGLLSIATLGSIPEAELATLLKPSGYFNAKARKVKAFISHLWDNYDGDLEAFLSRMRRACGWSSCPYMESERRPRTIYSCTPP